MCLAIYKPVGKEVPVKHLENGFENHSDGAGLAWAVDGKLHVKKGFFNFTEFITQYDNIKQYPCLIHFRKATHGKVDKANCHPFLFNDGKLALIHNGVISIKCSIDGLSDTAHFVKLVLEPMVKFHGLPINDGALNYLICTSIGSDKMAVMDGDGKTYIFNEAKGEWDAGVWYSNTSYRYSYKKAATYTPTATVVNNYQRASQGPNFRKHWDDSDEGDESYLAFWREATASYDENGGVPPHLPDPKTTRLLTGPPAHSEIFGKETVDDAGNVRVITADDAKTIDVEVEEVEEPNANNDLGLVPPFTEGQTTEYGWFDAETEAEVLRLKEEFGLSRENALLRIYSEK